MFACIAVHEIPGHRVDEAASSFRSTSQDPAEHRRRVKPRPIEQSIEPSRPTRAAVEPSPRRPYSPRGRKPCRVSEGPSGSRDQSPGSQTMGTARVIAQGSSPSIQSGLFDTDTSRVPKLPYPGSQDGNCPTLPTRSGRRSRRTRSCNGLSMIEARPEDTGAERRERD